MASELAQLESRIPESPQQEAEPEREDVDFEFNDEKDVFESDFESTDEEGEAGGEEEQDSIAERCIQEEERRMRRNAKTKLERAAALAHKHQRATFNPELYKPCIPRTGAPERWLQPAVTIDPETGEATESNKRKSQRTSTVLNRTATINRLLKDAKERSQVVKKPKAERRAPTQEELLKRAQEIEEKNVIEHRDYLRIEDEKRERARVVRPKVEGRLIRWVSKVEEEVVPLTPPVSPMPATSTSHMMPYRSPTSYPTQPYVTSSGQPSRWGSIPTTPSSPPGIYAGMSYSQSSAFPPSRSPSQSLTPSTSNATRPLEPLPVIIQRKRKVTKNYVVLENAQTEKAPRVTWKQKMEGMFGGHAKWEDVKVYSTKNRPMSRPRERCPITGLAANYVDPRTGIPYANVFAYQEIGKILQHDYVWNEEFGCYVGQEEAGTDEDDVQED